MCSTVNALAIVEAGGIAPLVNLLKAPADRRAPEWAALTIQYTAQHHRQIQVHTASSSNDRVHKLLFDKQWRPHSKSAIWLPTWLLSGFLVTFSNDFLQRLLDIQQDLQI